MSKRIIHKYTLILLLYFSPSLKADVIPPLIQSSKEFLVTHNKELCQASDTTNVPAELLAGVIITEAELNRGITDRVQDLRLKTMLLTKPERWWNKWKIDGEVLANNSSELRLLSNKWPIELWKTGYVQSFGSAQITPRTAFKACHEYINDFSVCKSGVKGIVKSISDDPSSFLIASIILKYEKEKYLLLFPKSLDVDVGVWATMYNVGWDYYHLTYIPRWGNTANNFGKHVSSRLLSIQKILKCKDLKQ